MRKNKERKILNIIGDFLSTFIMTIVIIIYDNFILLENLIQKNRSPKAFLP